MGEIGNNSTGSLILVQPFIDINVSDGGVSTVISPSVYTSPPGGMAIPTDLPGTQAYEPNSAPRTEQANARNVTEAIKTDEIDRNLNIAHVWALWGVVIAAGLLVIIIAIVMSLRCVVFLKKPRKPPATKAGKRVPKFRRGTPKLPPRPAGVMADHKDVRKDFFHSLERGNVQARRQEATRRWLKGNLATSLQFIDGSGSGGGQPGCTDQDGIPMHETNYRHSGLDRIPENRELHQEYSFITSPRGNLKTHHQVHPVVHRHANGNTNEFVRVFPLSVVRDQNANIALSPSHFSHSQTHFYPARARWDGALHSATHPRVYPRAHRAVSSEPPRQPISRQYRHPQDGWWSTGPRRIRTGGYGGGGGREGTYQESRRNPAKWTLPKFNLAGETIPTSSETSVNGVVHGCTFSPIWGDWSYDNTVFEAPNTPTPKLVVPANSPQTEDSSSTTLSRDSLNGVSAGVSQCQVSSDASVTVTIGTSKQTSCEWDFYDPGYTSQAVRFVNGVYVPVIGTRQYWV